MATLIHDLTGKYFGDLKVLCRTKTKGPQPFWICLCQCGETKVYEGFKLMNGKVKSCGCRKKKTKFGRNAIVICANDFDL